MKTDIDFETLRFSADSLPENLIFLLRFDTAVRDDHRELIKNSLEDQAKVNSLKSATFISMVNDDKLIELKDAEVVTLFIGANVEIYNNLLKDFLVVLYFGHSHVVYSNFKSQVEETSRFLPVWSPQRFINFDYLGQIVAIRSNDLQSVKEMSRDSQELRDFIWEIHLSGERISRIPRDTYEVLVYEQSNNTGVSQYRKNRCKSVSVVIPTRGVGSTTASSKLLKECLNSIARQDAVGVSLEVVIVVDFEFSSEIESYCKTAFQADTKVSQLVFEETFNFSKKCNFGAKSTSGEVVIFLNDDASFISTDGIKNMASLSLDHGVGAVGALLLFEDSSIQHSGIQMTSLRPELYFLDHFVEDLQIDLQESIYEVSAVTGACIAIERKKLEEIGYWNESLPNSYNDIDLCISLNSRGYQSIQMNCVLLNHFESASRDSSFDSKSFEILVQKFGRQLKTEKYLFSENCAPCKHQHGARFEMHNAFLGKPVSFLLHLIKSRGLIDAARYCTGRFSPLSARNSQICNTII